MNDAVPGGALRARKTWRTLEPLHGMVYFVPEAAEAYERLGITGRAGYFASRAAPMGAVQADVVVSTFFNFNPDLVQAAIPASWVIAAPAALVTARFAAVDAACRRLLGEEVLASAEMRRAADLARTAAEEAGRRSEGRPLAAAHAEVAWPAQPHLVLWHAQSILREYRGDGHIALLVVHGLSGIEALVTHAAAGDVPAPLLRSTRGWPEEAWEAAVEALRGRGWLERGDPLRFTEWGGAQRHAIEDGTDVLAAPPYDVLGEDGCAELRSLVRPWSTVFAEQLR
ncbi:MAG: SCO6745 family protein [Acidimicrobiales bacterium]